MNLKTVLPIFLSIALAVGVFMGYFLALGKNNGENNANAAIKAPILFSRNPNADKLVRVLNYVEKNYVDPVNQAELVEKIIEKFLAELDPHSFYISSEEFAAMNEPLQGNFDGIGVEFIIQEDTVVVVNPIVGGPSEKVGVRAGDRIIKVNNEDIAGTGIKNRDVMNLLRGEKGSTVKISNLRKSSGQVLDFEITRDKIPIYSVDAALMLNETTGYIKISRFGGTTVEEFKVAMMQLTKEKGMQKLVLDLRGNGGGYLNAAVDIADLFLTQENLIVYTEGKAVTRRNYNATGYTPYKDLPLVVLINQESASASEVLAGALQDNDRALIVGKRSFGKGLVQDQVPLNDGAALRLTVSRYYTPSGRSIQKPYGKGIDYREDLIDRFKSGELVSQDSIKTIDSLAFRTKMGRTVYGGGGITPDIFVPLDTASYGLFFTESFYRGLLNRYAFDFSDRNRDAFKTKYRDAQAYHNQFNFTKADYNTFIKFSAQNDLKPTQKEADESFSAISSRLKSLIGRNIFGNDAFYYEVLQDDREVKIAKEALLNPITSLK
ncbi:MAG: S41 family peptidase [Luteibaculaceae bacterium]